MSALRCLNRVFVISLICVVAFAGAVSAQSTAFRQALAQAVAGDDELASFYRARDYSPIWLTERGTNRARVQALVEAFETSDAHGLPSEQYNHQTLRAMIQGASGDVARGTLEGQLTRLFSSYARDIQTGILVPSRIDSEIVRRIPYRGRQATLVAFTRSNPDGFMRSLPPKTPEYARLMKEKLRFEQLIASGGWGPQVPGSRFEAGAGGDAVVMLRNRLIAMGFLGRTNTAVYDDAVRGAVQQFQLAHGLSADGVAGPGTLSEINKEPAERLTSIIVAMERERWMNRPRGDRHVWVNLTDFSAQIIDNNRVTFQTRSVVGKNEEDRRSPEFSDIMEFMVINPSWYVPRSITVNEYLPLLQRNPNAVSKLEMRDSRGNAVSRASVDFNSYDEDTFPYSFREPPSQGNALGLVKFMFPNRYNIYLHDTPAKALFGRETRAFSHGCVRLNDPFDFAYALLAPQTSDPVGFFQSRLRTGNESRVNLDTPVPVHLVYRTAFTQAGGMTQFRRDVYGRDGRIWNALRREGVALRAVRG
ncbi:MAG: L,D-transpeptidase family protein [Pseudomonadota bacterium]